MTTNTTEEHIMPPPRITAINRPFNILDSLQPGQQVDIVGSIDLIVHPAAHPDLRGVASEIGESRGYTLRLDKDVLSISTDTGFNFTAPLSFERTKHGVRFNTLVLGEQVPVVLHANARLDNLGTWYHPPGTTYRPPTS